MKRFIQNQLITSVFILTLHYISCAQNVVSVNNHPYQETYYFLTKDTLDKNISYVLEKENTEGFIYFVGGNNKLDFEEVINLSVFSNGNIKTVKDLIFIPGKYILESTFREGTFGHRWEFSLTKKGKIKNLKLKKFRAIDVPPF